MSSAQQATPIPMMMMKSVSDGEDNDPSLNEDDFATDVIDKTHTTGTFDMYPLGQIEPASSLEKTVTMEEVETKTGKTKSFSHWEYYAADKTHLSETLQSIYIFKWIFGMICGMVYIFIVEYLIFKLFNIHFCTIKNNTQPSNQTIKFLSNNAFFYAIQQFFAIVIGFSGYWCLRVPKIIGIKPAKFNKSRISIFILTCFIQMIIILFIPYKFQSYMSPLGALIFIVFGLICNGVEGGRRISIWILIILAFTLINGLLGAFVFNQISPNLFGIIYPFYLTIFETFIYYIISIFDIPTKCCKSLELNNENKQNESGLGCIYFWSDTDSYVFVASINVYIESWRIAAIILLKHDLTAMILTFVISIISEIFTRNNLYYEIIYRIIWRKSAPPLNRVYSIYLGCKLHTEYIPILLVIMYNLLGFGYTSDCYGDRIADNMDVTDCWWVIGAIFGLEFCCDIAGHWSNKLFVKVLKIFDKSDEARRVKYVKLKFVHIVFATIHLSFVAVQGFIIDANSRQLK